MGALELHVFILIIICIYRFIYVYTYIYIYIHIMEGIHTDKVFVWCDILQELEALLHEKPSGRQFAEPERTRQAAIERQLWFQQPQEL